MKKANPVRLAEEQASYASTARRYRCDLLPAATSAANSFDLPRGMLWEYNYSLLKVRAVMAIPDYQAVMLPVLTLSGDGREHHIREAINTLAEQFGLTEGERKELLPSGVDRVFDNRIGWARTYLKKAG